MVLRIGIVVGEPSGDLLAAQLIKALRQPHPELEVEGVIGPELRKAGATQLFAMDELSVMGLIEPLKRLPRLFYVRKWLTQYFSTEPPDVFIGIDAPDFNLGLEKQLNQKGIPTVHYVSPSVWAWRQGRVKLIRQAVDLMLTLFPFERKFYDQHQITAKFVGHPTADKVPLEAVDTAAAKEKLHYDPSDPLVLLLPGSRGGELKYMLPVYLQAAKLCQQAMPAIKFVLALVHEAYYEYARALIAQIAPELNLKMIIADSYAAMRAADVALVTSGTATLELLLHKKPMVVAYRTHWLTYEIVKRCVKVNHIALPNLLQGDQPIVPEYIQKSASPEQLSQALLELLKSPEKRAVQQQTFMEIHKSLKQDASAQAAQEIQTLLGL